MIDTIDQIVVENFQICKLNDPLERCIAESNDIRIEHEHIIESVMQLEINLMFLKRHKYLDLRVQSNSKSKPSIEDPPNLELKPLPSHLKYAFFFDELLVLIFVFLTES